VKTISLRRPLPGIVVLAGVLLVGSTGGAVAGSAITGAQIKDGTVTGADVKNASLRTKDLAPAAVKALSGKRGARGPAGPSGPVGPVGVSGYQYVTKHVTVPANTPESVAADCPAGTVSLGGSGYWLNSTVAVQFYLGDDDALALSTGIPTSDTLYLSLTCASVSP
jgi:hypothetical protein